ncbi:MAG TPA: DUF4426 domain-containing protein [Salinisphaeraceae bacterium]|nr:DUF4426 domain-containing protein [Salinisphaeraceae bacterium]
MLALLCAAASFSTHAEAYKSGAYVVQYSVVNSMLLPAAVADRYGFKRSGERAIISVTLQRPSKNEPLQALPAQVSGQAKTLLEQRQELDFRQVDDGDSAISLAEFKLAEKEQTLTFELRIKPADSERTIPLRFTETLYQQP